MSLALFWVNAWLPVALLVIAIVVHLQVRKGPEIARLALATKIGVGIVVALVALTVIIFLMTGPMG